VALLAVPLPPPLSPSPFPLQVKIGTAVHAPSPRAFMSRYISFPPLLPFLPFSSPQQCAVGPQLRHLETPITFSLPFPLLFFSSALSFLAGCAIGRILSSALRAPVPPPPPPFSSSFFLFSVRRRLRREVQKILTTRLAAPPTDLPLVLLPPPLSPLFFFFFFQPRNSGNASTRPARGHHGAFPHRIPSYDRQPPALLPRIPLPFLSPPSPPAVDRRTQTAPQCRLQAAPSSPPPSSFFPGSRSRGAHHSRRGGATPLLFPLLFHAELVRRHSVISGFILLFFFPFSFFSCDAASGRACLPSPTSLLLPPPFFFP